MMESGNHKVLCVDDEAAVLTGLQRSLAFEFQIETATSAIDALALLKRGQKYAVIMSDMRMPEMNGAQFLAVARELAPDTTRMLLTGQADVPSAIAAVNDGQIFRFLTKPCPTEQLTSALRDGLRQYDLVLGERVLLEQTLRGGLRSLCELVSLLAPAALGPLARAEIFIRKLSLELGLAHSWQIEVAATFGHLSMLTLPEDTLARLYQGTSLDSDEASMVRRCNVVAQRLVAQIPRLGPVRDLLRQAGNLVPADTDSPRVRVLRVALDYCGLCAARVSTSDALTKLHTQRERYGKDVIGRFSNLVRAHEAAQIKELRLDELEINLILAEPLMSTDGRVLLPAEAVLTEPLLERVRNFSSRQGVKEPIRARAGG